jgi:3-oxoacyl-[acyl-carrier protein] reductase
MRYDFAGKNVMVTGAGHGLGRAIAVAFTDLGADVLALDLDEDRLQETAREAGAPCRARRLDVTDRGAVQALVAENENAHGPVSILVNCAGGVRGQVGRPLEEITPADWQSIVDANMSGAFWCTQAVAPAMKEQGYGRIVNISSRAGLATSLTGIQAYASAKAGLIGLTRQLGHELGRFGITVNSIAPGFVRSNPTTERQWEAMGADGQALLVESIALRRLGTPADIVHGVLFFASDFASWITGQVLSVDGGR